MRADALKRSGYVDPRDGWVYSPLAARVSPRYHFAVEKAGAVASHRPGENVRE